MADAASVPQGFARTLTQKSEAMLRGRDRWLERADEAMRRSEAALERHQAAVVGSLEAEAQARLHRDILPLLAPELRAYGRLTTLSVFGAGLLGKQSVDVAGRLAVQCCAGPEEEADGADSQGVPATEYYLRMFAQPVLEPFLEGMHEPLRTAVPLFLGAMAAYGASCLGLGFLLGRRQREK